MIALIAVELGLIVLGAIVFLALFGSPARSQDPPVARHVAVFTAITGVEAGLLLAALFGLQVPAWVFAVLFGAQDGLIGQRLWFVIRARRHGRG